MERYQLDIVGLTSAHSTDSGTKLLKRGCFQQRRRTADTDTDIIEWWKEHFEELLNPTNTFSVEEAEFEDPGEALPISLAEVAEVVKKLLSSKAPGVDEIHPEMPNALCTVRLSWLTHLFSVAWRSGTVPVEWQTGVVVPIFKKGDRRLCSS